ncbi:MAG: hypothetical protein EPO20_15675 [Betaproteobacteria bacterium]|nr:MAG: hypothetical protein EPO20_15675 [Betaproteobacteria bacterium]
MSASEPRFPARASRPAPGPGASRPARRAARRLRRGTAAAQPPAPSGREADRLCREPRRRRRDRLRS